MGRRKRSEKAVEGAGVAAGKQVARRKPAPAPMPAGESLQAFCPVCGKMVMDRAVKVKYMTLETVPYFQSIEWDPDKPFGVAKSIAGRGSFKDWRYIQPEEAPELFEGMKGRLLQAVSEWLAKGWVSQAEVMELIK